MKVLIVTYRRAELLERVVSQLDSYFRRSDILVVDNYSIDSPAIAEVCASNGVQILRNEVNAGFARAVNQGMRHLLADAPDWVLLLNPDTDILIDPHVTSSFASPDTACISTFDSAAARPWDSAKPIPNPWRAAWEDAGYGRIRLPQPLGSRFRSAPRTVSGYLVGCYLIISSAAWLRIGEFDERFWLYSEEVDWCLRASKAGMKCELAPFAGFRHEAGQSAAGSISDETRAARAYRESRVMFLEKHWGTRGVQTYHRAVAALNSIRRGAGTFREAVKTIGRRV